MSDTLGRIAWAGLQRNRAVPPDLVGAFIPTGSMAVLPSGTLSPYVANVVDFGATGNDETDDSWAFQEAIDSLAYTGGVLYIPPAVSGKYKIGRTLRQKSNIIIQGSGPASTLRASADFVPSPDYGGTAMWLNENAESDETHFTGYRDFNITFQNVWIDNTDRTRADVHGIFNRAVQRVRILNCNFLGGGNATAAVTCDDYVIDGCRAVGQTNCCYDHWGGSTNVRVVNSYAKVSEVTANQVVNFNALRTASTPSGPTETWVSDGFILANCDLFGPTTAQRSINFEPLGVNCSTKNVQMIGNRCYNVRVVISSNTSGVQIIGNKFSDSFGNTSTIWARNFYSLDADDITIAHNHFIDCASPANFGLIDSTATNTRVYGNAASGGTYDYGIVFRGVTGEAMANNFPDAVLNDTSGNYGAGDDIRLTNDQSLEFLGTNNHRPYFKMATDSLFLVTTTAANAPRSVWSIATASDTAQFVIYPNVAMSGLVRNGYAEGLVAAGSSASNPLLLTEQNNVVATTAAGTGVRLPTATGGGMTISVWNDGANTLNVYPPAGGQINSGGVNVPVTLATGTAGRWVSISAGSYRTAA